jgi:hypothetical protein
MSCLFLLNSRIDPFLQKAMLKYLLLLPVKPLTLIDNYNRRWGLLINISP